MIKRYNQFIKENIGEEESIEKSMTDVESKTMMKPEVMGNQPLGEEEEVEIDPYEKALMDLANEAGLDYEQGSKMVVIDGKEVTYPSEKSCYQIRGIKGDFETPQQVLDAISSNPKGNRTKVGMELKDIESEVQTPGSNEPSFDETEEDFRKRDLEADINKLESKSYKTKRFKRV